MQPYFAFQLHITDTCDQRCRHCYIYAEDHHVPVKEMDYDRIVSVVSRCEEMCARMGRPPYFYVTGGDPLLHRRFWDVLGLLKERNHPFSLLGNPFHLDGKVCRRLKELGCERYQMSLDGLEETHDRIRKPGSFATTLDRIACLREAGIRTVVMATVSGTNLHEIPELIDLVVAHRVDVFAFARYCPTSREKSAHITPTRYREFLGTCWDKFEELKDRGTTFSLKDHLWTLLLHERGLYPVPEASDPDTIYDGCNCASNHLTILPDGDLYACRRFESKVGNVFESHPHEVFMGAAMEPYRRYERLEKCGACELLRFCRGCPAVAYGHTGNFLAADPQCWKET